MKFRFRKTYQYVNDFGVECIGTLPYKIIKQVKVRYRTITTQNGTELRLRPDQDLR